MILHTGRRRRRSDAFNNMCDDDGRIVVVAQPNLFFSSLLHHPLHGRPNKPRSSSLNIISYSHMLAYFSYNPGGETKTKITTYL
jgi:hypothetical protein